MRRGQVDLRLGSVDELPDLDARFDKVLAVNVTLFWDRPVELLGNLRSVLTPGGRIALAFQPRGPGATDDAATATGKELVVALRDAGFSQLRLETLKLKPAVVCILGVNAPGEPSGGLDSTQRLGPLRGASSSKRRRCGVTRVGLRRHYVVVCR